MKKRIAVVAAVFIAAVFAAALTIPSLRWPLLGYLRGEAFSFDMPQSYYVSAIQNGDVRERRMSADVLGSDKFSAEAVIPALSKALAEDSDEEVRYEAAHSLSRIARRIGPKAIELVPILRQGVRDPYMPTCATSAQALGDIGPAAKAAVPDLIEALDRHPYTSVASQMLHYAITEMGPSAIPGLVAAMDNPAETGKHVLQPPRVRASSILLKIAKKSGDEARAAIPGCIKALSDKHARMRMNAAKILGAIGHDAKEAIPALLEALQDSEQDGNDGGGYYSTIADAIARIGPSDKSALPILLEVAKDPKHPARREAADLIIRFYPDAAGQLPKRRSGF